MNMKKIAGFVKNSYLRIKEWLKGFPERQKNAKQKRVEKLFELVGTNDIALADELANTWVFPLFRLFLRFVPTESAHDNVNYQVKRLDKLNFLKSDNDNLKISSAIDLSFVRYHSIAARYRSIREFFQPLAWTIVFMIVSMPLAVAVGMIIGFFGLISRPVENSVGIQFSAPETGNYFVAVRNSSDTVDPYTFGIQRNDPGVVISMPPKGSVQPISFGQELYATVTSSESQNLYEIKGNIGQIIYVQPNLSYWDMDIRMQILNPDLSGCNQAIVINKNSREGGARLTCLIATTEAYYLNVETVEPLTLLSQGHYGFSLYSLENEVEPNDSQKTSSSITLGRFVQGDVSVGNPDWYSFSAQKGDQLNIYSSPDDPANYSLTLYQNTPAGLNAISYSTQPVEWKTSTFWRVLDTKQGQAMFYSLLLGAVGVHPSDTWLAENTYVVMLWLDSSLVFLGFLLLFGFFALEWRINPRRYLNSIIVNRFIDILEQLDSDTLLQSEDQKARLRVSVKTLSLLIPDLHSVSRWYFFRAPRVTRNYFDNISALVLKTNESITIPNNSTLQELRTKYVRWLNLFMKEEFGSFDDEIDRNQKLPWYRPFVTAVQQHWLKGLLLSVAFFLFAVYLTNESPELSERLFNFGSRFIRYLILIGGVMAVYLQWGPSDSEEQTNSKWKNAAKFILFFLAPFIILDSLLDTGVVTTLATLISSVSIP
jgi:hypothetical protein